MSIDDHGGWPGVLASLTAGRDLSGEACTAVLGEILRGDVSDTRISAFIVALRQKGETVEELTGLQRAMMAVAEPLHLPSGTTDLVGAGGAPSRRKHALNVSTMAAFVAAGAGATICKHGNLKASSTSGSFDFLDALGLEIADAATLETQVSEHGIGFAFARAFHPAVRHVGPVRVELGIPTVFNILGPLSHPGGLDRQVIGTADRPLMHRLAETLRATGSVRSLVVHGDGDLDELTTTGPSWIVSLDEGEITETEIDATDYGLSRVTPDALAGGDATANAEIAARVLGGEAGPPRDIVVLNAAAGLVAAGVVASIGEGVEAAQAAIDDGRAAAKLAALQV
ncbi:MAG: anthranilate phosphoribosyltransferase [Actinomycetota bacterium]